MPIKLYFISSSGKHLGVAMDACMVPQEHGLVEIQGIQYEVASIMPSYRRSDPSVPSLTEDHIKVFIKPFGQKSTTAVSGTM